MMNQKVGSNCSGFILIEILIQIWPTALKSDGVGDFSGNSGSGGIMTE
jgi:hypothetical protein